MKFEKLRSIFTITSGGTPLTSKREYYENGNIPWVKTGDLKVKYLMEVPDSITKTGLENSSAKMFPPKTVLIAMYGATIGACSILKIAAATNQACGAILPNENVNEEYLYYYLSSIKQSFINKGVGGGQPNISATILKETKFPFIPISDQLQIANILSHAENLIAFRKESIRLLDEFLKSTFLEMFGDPNKNPKSWPVEKLKNYFQKEPQNGLYKHSSEYGSGTKILRIDSFYNGKVYGIDNLKRLKLSIEEIEKYGLSENDIVINRVNSREYLGKSGLIPFLHEPVVFESNMMRFSIDIRKLHPVYLIKLLDTNYLKGQILSCAKDAVNQSSINQQDVKSFSIIIPPLTLQTQFAQIVEKTEALKTQYQQSLQELESLYGSLSQRAFKGELMEKDGEMMMAAEEATGYRSENAK